MIIVDVEASGVDPVKCSLVSVGAVDFDNPENRFYEECRIWDGAHVEDEALAVTGMTRTQITDPKKQTDREVTEKFLGWIKTCKEYTLAGQNPSFDRDFLQQTAYRYHINWPLAHRTVDLHSIAYFHLIKQGLPIPLENNHSKINLNFIIKHVGLNVARGKHNALEDALLEAECFSRLFYGKILISEYSKFPVMTL